MTKALLVGAINVAIADTERSNFFGAAAPAVSGNEANTRFYVTEELTLSLLRAHIASGGNGTNTVRVRDGAADGNLVASDTGAIYIEDSSHTDVISAAGTFNISHADTGTTPTFAYIGVNVEFTSGHGSCHASFNGTGITHDSASSTRYIPWAGALTADGLATEANAQWRNRAYSSQESMHVRVNINARTNTSTFRNRIGGADGTLVCSYGAGVTGLVFDDNTGAGDALAAGDLINASLTLGSGTQDLDVTIVGSIFKSSTKKSDCIVHGNAVTRTASATAGYHPVGGRSSTLNATESIVRTKVGFPWRASNLRIYSSNTYTGDGTLKLIKNGTAVLTTTLTAGASAGWLENSTDTASGGADDEISFEFDEGSSGTLTYYAFGVTLEDTVTGTSAQILPNIEQSGSGAETFTGTSAQTLANIEQSASGTAGDAGASGTAAQVLPNIEQAASAGETFTGTSAQSLPRLSQSASGHMAPSGTAAQTLPNVEQSASGAERFIATSAQVLPSVDQSATGVMHPSGTAAQELPSIVQSASGTQTQNVTGTAAQVLPSIEQQAAAAETFTGSASQLLPAIEQAGSGALQIIGVGAQTLAAIIQSASGTQTTLFIGTAESLLPAIEQAALGVITNPEEPEPRVATSGLRATPGQIRRNAPGPSLRSGSPQTTSRRNSPPTSGR